MTQHADSRSELLRVIHDVRRRWRLKLALRGAAIAAACLAVALVLSALTLQWLRFTTDSILAFRVVLAVVTGLLAYVFLVRPLLRRVTDEQVAMYLEEHEPSLEAAIISAVEAGHGEETTQSPVLVRKLVETAAEKCRAIEDGRRVVGASPRPRRPSCHATIAAPVTLPTCSLRNHVGRIGSVPDLPERWPAVGSR